MLSCRFEYGWKIFISIFRCDCEEIKMLWRHSVALNLSWKFRNRSAFNCSVNDQQFIYLFKKICIKLDHRDIQVAPMHLNDQKQSKEIIIPTVKIIIIIGQIKISITEFVINFVEKPFFSIFFTLLLWTLLKVPPLIASKNW